MTEISVPYLRISYNYISSTSSHKLICGGWMLIVLGSLLTSCFLFVLLVFLLLVVTKHLKLLAERLDAVGREPAINAQQKFFCELLDDGF